MNGRATTRRAPAPFDLYGPLPTGTTVLEASAGTGKTFTIAALAARYVAEGHATLPEVMLVTFGREATQELRERVRERLVSAERGLAFPGAARAGTDRLLALLADAPDAEVAVRRGRLALALAQFDAATIATTHQFCQQMLAGLGVAGDSDPDAVFVESVDDLVAEVVDDFYVRKFAARSQPGRGRARRRSTTPRHSCWPARPSATRRPGSNRSTPRPAAPRRCGTASPTRSAARCGCASAPAASTPTTTCSPASPTYWRTRRAARRHGCASATRWCWSTSSRTPTRCSGTSCALAFHGHTDLVLIGDPKQAIYAFRGADVVSYLDATEAAGATATLGRNHRSDAPLLRALDTVFAGAALGDPRIVVREVGSVHPGRRLDGAPVDAPLRLRVVSRDGLPLAPRRPLAVVGPAREVVARDVAADVAALLASPARIGERPVVAG